VGHLGAVPVQRFADEHGHGQFSFRFQVSVTMVARLTRPAGRVPGGTIAKATGKAKEKERRVEKSASEIRCRRSFAVLWSVAEALR
jgi:hypothetical protein